MVYNKVIKKTCLILFTLDPFFSCFCAVLFVALALWRQGRGFWHNLTSFQGAWRTTKLFFIIPVLLEC